MVQEINGQEDFEKVVKNANTPVIVDFWASWCGPCKMMAPVFEELSGEYEGKLAFVKVNVEENEELAGANNISGIPCLIVYNNGEEVDRIVGFNPKPQLQEKIEAALGKA